MDFVADELTDGRRFRTLTVVDVFTRECLEIEIGQSLKAEDVVRVLERLKYARGVPARIYCDNGSEFVSGLTDQWAYANGVKLEFSRLGKPTDNAVIESFNGRFSARTVRSPRDLDDPAPTSNRSTGKPTPPVLHDVIGAGTPHEGNTDVRLHGELKSLQDREAGILHRSRLR